MNDTKKPSDTTVELEFNFDPDPNNPNSLFSIITTKPTDQTVELEFHIAADLGGNDERD